MTGRRWFGLRAGASNWLWIAIGVMLLDQWTKYLVTGHLAEFEQIVLLPMLEIMRLHNEGAAFSMLSAAGGWQRWFFTGLGLAVSIGILLWLRRMPAKGQNLAAAGLSLILGGALGNVFDRVRSGKVTDFIDFYLGTWHWYTFNLADAAICIGAGLLILGMFLAEKAQNVPTPVSDR